MLGPLSKSILQNPHHLLVVSLDVIIVPAACLRTASHQFELQTLPTRWAIVGLLPRRIIAEF